VFRIRHFAWRPANSLKTSWLAVFLFGSFATAVLGRTNFHPNHTKRPAFWFPHFAEILQKGKIAALDTLIP